jgi:membrane-associated phospholipid phosphatase
LANPRVLPLLAVLAITGNHTDQRIFTDSIVVGAQVGITTRLLKIAFGRKRPRHETGPLCGPSLRHDSFPSGHTSVAFAVATVYAQHRGGSGAIAYGLASLAGWSRIAEGHHWPKDVLGGAVLGVVAGKSRDR